MSRTETASRPLDIVLVGINYGPEPTGIAPYTQGMAEALNRRGHRVRVITSYPSYPAWTVSEGYRGRTMRETINGVPVLRLRTPVPQTPSSLRRVVMETVFGARAAVRRLAGADVVVTVSPALFSAALVGARTHLIRPGRRPAAGVWVQDLYGLGLRETGHAAGRAERAVTRVEAATLRAADGVAVIHERFAEHARREMGADTGVRVIGNWSHITPADDFDRAALRRRHGWADDETVVLHAGNMGVKQGLESVVAAARLAAERGEKLRFVLMGDGNRRPELERLARDCPSLQFIDPVAEDEFPRMLVAADVLLLNELPSLSEMCVPSKLTSYFAAGRPVLAATGADGVSAGVVREAGAGVVVEPGSPEALVAGALELAGDPERCRALGEAGRRYCDTMLGADRAVDEFESWIRSMVDGKGSQDRRGHRHDRRARSAR